MDVIHRHSGFFLGKMGYAAYDKCPLHTDPICKIQIFSPTFDGIIAFEVTSFVIAPMPVLETLSEYLLMSLYLFNLFKIYLNVPLGTFYLSSSVCVSVYMR